MSTKDLPIIDWKIASQKIDQKIKAMERKENARKEKILRQKMLGAGEDELNKQAMGSSNSLAAVGRVFSL